MASTSPLSTREIGDGHLVLIIHGWEMDSKVEELDLEPIFANYPGYRRIYVDLPGMGTTPANGIKNLDDIYYRLVAFVDARIGTSRFLITGSSCGGYLARALAQKYAEQVDGLLLRVPLIEPENQHRDLDTFEPLVQDEKFLSRLSSDEKAQLKHVLVQTPAYVQSLQAKYEAVIRPALVAADSKVLDPIRADPQRYRLSGPSHSEQIKLLAPTLIICGRQDMVVGYRDSLRLLEFYPRSTFVVLDRAGHDLPIEQSGVFDALVRDWLARVGEWRQSTGR